MSYFIGKLCPSIGTDVIEANELLKMIDEHFITVRGFSFASAFIEKFKQSARKSTEKLKGLRKTLDSANNDHAD